MIAVSRKSYRLLTSVLSRSVVAMGAIALALLATACSAVTESGQPERTVATVSVSPTQHALLVGDYVDLNAQALDDKGAVLDGKTIAWSSNDESVASVTPNGRATAIAPGTARIHARVDGKAGFAELVVSARPPVAVASVELAPSSLSLETGDTRTLEAVPRDAQGNPLSGRTITWSSEDETVATVDAAGRIMAKKVGASAITATVEGKSASVALTVIRPAVAWIGISPTSLVLEVGQSRQMAVVVRDARGNLLTDRVVTWKSDTSNASVSPTGLVTGVHPGYATIIATSEGKSAGIGATISAAEAYDYDLLYFRRRESTGSEIFTLTLGGTSAPVRINAGDVSSQPTANPAGTRIAFVVSQIDLTTHERIADIFAVDRNGMNMKRLTTAPGYDDWPAWSPDGAKIVYRHFQVGEGQRYDIWVMNADGSSPTNLTADMPDDAVNAAPTWSPDGTRIVFASSRTDASGATSSIWTMRTDGTDKRQLTSTLTGFDATPSWSPDGQRIAFIRYYDGGESDITFVNATGGATTRLEIAGTQWTPAWSPDGRYIAYVQQQGPNENIYTVAPNGTAARLRTVDPEWGGGLKPVWIRK